ncbi:C39 family peptidase [Paenibacillus sp. GCM10027628]|uniref:C39 family peptidase n=1 Tax=Paenibacillus sp. GCM10027628 TaxID=3273413 RepID=UPI00363BC846
MKGKFTSILIIFAVLFLTQPNMTYSDEDPHHYQIPDVAALSQLPELPNGCEAVAATMLLNWAGVTVTKEEVAKALPKGELPQVNDDGAWVGANPEQVFVGDPFGVGFGIYHKPVADTLNHYLPGQIKDITGSSLDDLLETVKSGRPVMVWATEHMDSPFLEDEWQDADGTLIDWYDPEHALLLTGWDDDHAYLNDPMTGEQETYNLWGFKTVWEAMGSQAITVTENYHP